MHIKFRLDIQQNVGLARRCQHLRGIHAIRTQWHGSGQIATDTIRRFTQEAELRSAQCGDLLGQQSDLRSLRMLLREVAQQHRSTFAARQTARDGARLRGGLHSFDDLLRFARQRG